MKPYLIFTALLLANLQNNEVEGIRLGKVTVPVRSQQEIIKISSIKGSYNQDHDLLPKTDEFPSGINRKLMTKFTSSSTTITISKNHKHDGNEHNPKQGFKLVRKEENLLFSLWPENSKQWMKVASEPNPNDTEIMDYTPTRTKTPILN